MEIHGVNPRKEGMFPSHPSISREQLYEVELIAGVGSKSLQNPADATASPPFKGSKKIPNEHTAHKTAHAAKKILR